MEATQLYPEIRLNWKRPDHEGFPKIWMEYKIKQKSGAVANIRIQDVQPSQHSEIAKFAVTHFLRDEPICRCLKLQESEEYTEGYRYVYSSIQQQGMSLVAYIQDENSKQFDVVAGVRIQAVRSRTDPDMHRLSGRPMEKIANAVRALEEGVDVFDLLQSGQYLYSWCLCVAPEYRGLGIGRNILTVTEEMCKTFGVKGSKVIFTSSYSQKIAEDAGYTVYREMLYKDYKNSSGEVIFPVTDTDATKLMYKQFF